jgi:dihydrofolate synthase/folylpolyglutamate synthase
MKLGLRNIRALLASVDHPEKKFPSIHIAGTNGKGSTAAFLSSIAMESGLRTALYTSPHLLNFTERIRIDGAEIPESRLVDYTRALRPSIDRTGATFFEATTCIAFQYFADEHVDVAIIEAGLGGRLDSTNVLTPLVSIITNVGLDHTEILGKTVVAIAREKGGIIKRGIPCVTSSADTKVIASLRRIAGRKSAPFFLSDTLVKVQPVGRRSKTIEIRGRKFRVKGVRAGLGGEYQLENIRTAVAALSVLQTAKKRGTVLQNVSRTAIRRGIENVRRNSGILGRLEFRSGKVRTILDVAHNPPGLYRLIEALRARGINRIPVVFGVMRDKDYGVMIRLLADIAQIVVAVAPSMKRALPARRLHSALQQSGIVARLGGTVENGLRIARTTGRTVLVTGSHYVVSEALRMLDRKKG